MTPRAPGRRPVVERAGSLRFYATAHTVLVVRTPEAAYKVARVSFGRDGSIYVQFPYCREKAGWVGVLPIEAGQAGPVTYTMRDHGAPVSTDVKFAHHASGEVHFSKTGHDVPRTRRQSFPLGGPIGHVFHLQVFRPAAFTRIEKRDKGALYFELDFRFGAPTGAGWRAEWRRKRDVVDSIHPPGGVAGPATTIQHRATGVQERVVLVGQPPGYALRDHVLLLTGGADPLPAGVDGPGMAFLGGWNAHEVASPGDGADLGGCLAFLYPYQAQASADPDLADTPGAPPAVR